MRRNVGLTDMPLLDGEPALCPTGSASKSQGAGSWSSYLIVIVSSPSAAAVPSIAGCGLCGSLRRVRLLSEIIPWVGCV